jgi:large subunit ribosomal protein L28
MKPNVNRKNLYSDILDMKFSMWISTKARKCIMKAGSFDNYLLTTKPEVIDSRMGLYLRGLIKQKKSDPEFEVPYIPG